LFDPTFKEGNISKSSNKVSVKSSSFHDDYKKLVPIVNSISSKVLYPAVSAQTVSEYIRRQMSSPPKLKDLDFRINLKTGISMLALFLIKRLPVGSSICGLRIVCSGK
jgi:hypothetical protein